MRHLTGLAAIAPAYDGFILDLWGVIHNGVTAYPEALHCLQQLAGRPTLMLSNAPRRAGSVQRTIRRMGVPDALYTHILTSGEATWQALHTRADPWFAALGDRIYHLGPARDRGVMEGLGTTLASTPETADFLLNTGPDDTREAAPLDAFIAELRACLDANLPMICANPDLEIVRGEERILCAGSLAAWYEAEGGDVRWIGKPDPAIYATALSLLGLPPTRVLAIGDSLRTDIAGAQAAGIDSLWVLGGIHGEEIAGNPARAIASAATYGVPPSAMIDRLTW
jgi:HAD superfamily hydrolase (TIGR01459 family)